MQRNLGYIEQNLSSSNIDQLKKIYILTVSLKPYLKSET